MRRLSMGTRIALVALAALLALPLAPTVSPAAAKNRSWTMTKAFQNSAGINLPTHNVSPVSSSNRYPSFISVRGVKGTIRDINLTLNRFDHTHPDEVQVLLVGPRGQTAIVMANVGGSDDVSNVTLRLDDEAEASLPDLNQLQSGAFRPTNATGSAIAFNVPAPGAGANAALSVFDGSDPNGTWRLFVQDANGPTGLGAVSDGWNIEITTQFKAKKKKR